MTKNDIQDLKIWKANLELILKTKRSKLEAIRKIVHYAESRPEVVCMISKYREQKPELLSSIAHIDKVLGEINIILEIQHEQSKYPDHHKAVIITQAGFYRMSKRPDFISLQREQALLVN
jgi:hypothetical protein